MTENSGDKTQVRTYGPGTSYVTSVTSPGTWLIQSAQRSLASVLIAVRNFATDYQDMTIKQVTIMQDHVDGGYIAVVIAEAQ